MRTSGHAISTQASTALAAGLIAFPVAAAAGHPAATATGHQAPSRTAPAARAPRGPSLSISVTDGHVTATTGQRLTYTVSLRDTGAAAARHLKITQNTVPRAAAPVGQRQRHGNGHGGHLARHHPCGGNTDLPGHRHGYPDPGPGDPPGRDRLRRATRRQAAPRLRGPPRPPPRPPRQQRPRPPGATCPHTRQRPDRARGRPGYRIRRPPHQAQAAASDGLTVTRHEPTGKLFRQGNHYSDRMRHQRLKSVVVEGFTSIQSGALVRGLNMLVGANGAGKSNFIRALGLLGRIIDSELGLSGGVMPSQR